MIDRKQGEDSLNPGVGVRRSLLPAFLLAASAALTGFALSGWIWHARVDAERAAVESSFHATAQEVITRMDTDVRSALRLGRAMAATIRLRPDLSADEWAQLLRDVQIDRLEPPVAAVMLVGLTSPEAADMRVRYSKLLEPDALGSVATEPWVLRVAQRAAARALLDADAAVASGDDGTADGVSLVALAVPVTTSSVLLKCIDARRWLSARGAILTEGAAVRAVEIGGAGHDRIIASTPHFPQDAATTEVGVFTQGDQRWAFEVAPLVTPPGYLPRLGQLLPGVVLSLLLAGVLFALMARKQLAERVAMRVKHDLADRTLRFERALAASEDGIWEFRPETARCHLSQRACELLDVAPRGEGYRIAELVRRALRPDRAAVLAALRHAVDAGAALDLACRIAVGGEVRWLRIRGNRPDAGNRAASTIGAVSDVSLHKRLSERLARQQALLSRILDVVPVPLAVKRRDGCVQLVNRAFERSFGIPRERALGLTMRELAAGGIGVGLDVLDARLPVDGDAAELRVWADHAGARRHFRVAHSLCDTPGEAPVVVASYIDVTDETEAASRQEAFRDYLQRLINAMPHAFFVKDAESRFVMVNPAFCRLYDLEADAIIGKRSAEIYSEAPVAERQMEDDRRVLAGGETLGSELRFRTRAGALRVTRVHKVLCHDVVGSPHVVGVVTDISDLVEAQEGQREVIDRLDALYRNAPFGLVLVDELGRVIQANPAFCKLFGFSEAQLLFRNVDMLSPPELRRDHRGRFASLLGSGRLTPFETRYLDAEGNAHAVRVAGAGVGRVGGGYRLAWGIVEDVSAQVAAAQALAASEHRWQFALEGAGDGVWDWNAVTNRVFFSPRWKAMLGYAESEIGDSLDEWSRRVHPDDLPQTLALVQAHIAGEHGDYQSEHRMRCKDGSWKWILDRGKVIERDGAGRALRLIGTHSDISERKRAEAELRQSAALLATIRDVQEAFIREPDARSALDGLLAGVMKITDSPFGFIGEVRYDDGTPYLKIHAVAERGTGGAERVTRLDAELRDLDSLAGSALRRGTAVVLNDTAAAPSGLPFAHPAMASFLGLPVRYGDQLVGMIGAANRAEGYTCDLGRQFEPLLRTFGEIINARRTEGARRAAEAELSQHRDRLTELVREQTADLIVAKEVAEAASEAKGMFLANMSHELRTPLHAVLSFARLGESKTGKTSEERLREYFTRITHSGERLLNLLNDLLDLSKLEAGHMQIDLRATDLAELVRDGLQEFAALLAAKRLNADLHVSVPITAVWADPMRLGQVFRNLLSNAVKFTPEGRTIQLTLAATYLHGLGGAETSAIELAVSDEGIGIPEGELESVFDKFVQSSKTRTGAGGTGLGLAISREIIAAHGGVIFARNNPAGGACFVVRLPAAEDLERE